MSQLNVILLGPPRVLSNDVPVTIKRRKALALLAYLAVTRRYHTRESLAALLWPDTGTGRAHANLRNLIWVLRQNGFSDYLAADHETVEIRCGPGLQIDVSEFRSRMTQAARGRGENGIISSEEVSLLTEAVKLYRAPFLTGFGLKDNLAFEDWQMNEEESLRTLLAEGLERLVSLHEESRQLDTAIHFSRKWLTLDPLNEPVQHRLIYLLARSGKRADALSQYNESARIMKKDLGLDMPGRTVELRDRIHSGALEESDRERELKSENTVSTNAILPAQPTPFLGRESELGEIDRTLTDPERRLLTIVGPGGSGKTRLALQAAGKRTDHFPDGVFFIPFASVDNSEFILPTLIDALCTSLTDPGSESTDRSGVGSGLQRHLLIDFLRDKRILLVLDNLEHLLEGFDFVGDILNGAPGVTLLATSREQLHITGESVLELEGLHYPEEGTDEKTLDRYSAVQLFLQGARRADLGFRPSRVETRDAASICRLLHGNPLGIEISATWVKMFSCDEIVDEIGGDLDFLTTDLRNIPERHRSLRAVFEHSWKLLSRCERSCLRRLAVFRGGFSRAAAGEVSGCSLLELSALVDKSLVRKSVSGHYEIHEVLRQYAVEKLRDDPREESEVRTILSSHYLSMLAGLETAFKGKGQKRALRELTLELENVREAWLTAAENGRVGMLRDAFMGFFLYYDIRNRFQEGIEMCSEAIELLSDEKSSENRRLIGMLHGARGWFYYCYTPTAAPTELRRSLDILEPFGPGPDLAFGRTVASCANFWTTRLIAKEKLLETLVMYKDAGDHWGTAMSLECLAFHLRRAAPAEALRHAKMSLTLRRRQKDLWGIALSQFILGLLAEEQGMPHAAKKRYMESLRLRRNLGEDKVGVVQCLQNLGRIERNTGRFKEAERLFEESIRRARKLGNRWLTAVSLSLAGQVRYDLTEYELSRHNLEEALSLLETIGDTLWTEITLSSLANVAHAENDPDEMRFMLQQLRAEPARTPPTDRTGVPQELVPVSLPPNILYGLAAAKQTTDTTEALHHLSRSLKQSLGSGNSPTTIEILIEMVRRKTPSVDPWNTAAFLDFVIAHPMISPRAKALAEELLENEGRTISPEERRRAIEYLVAKDLREIAIGIADGLGWTE